jgi:CHAT domain-containing protein
MSKTGSIVCFALIVAGVGTVLRTAPPKKTRLIKPSSHERAGQLRVPPRLNEAYNLLLSGQYLRAEELYRSVLGEAKAQGAAERAGRCLTAIGNCQFAMFRYRDALKSYLEARTFAETAQDWANRGSLSANISGLFLQMGDLDAAAHSAEQALADFNRQDFRGGRSRCLILLAVVRAKQGRMEESAALTGEAVDHSYREGDWTAVAQAWDHLGEEYLAHGQLAGAEGALTEGFRVRLLHRLPQLDSSYLNLGKLRLAQGDAVSAGRLLDEAIARQARSGTLVTPWEVYHARGEAHLAQGSAEAALADFGKALDLARQWRVEVLPADFTRISSEGELQKIYSSYIDAAGRLHTSSGRAQRIRECFRAVEENRAASLHALLREPNDWREAMPPQYWETLAQLRAAEASLVQSDTETRREEMRQLRAALVMLEAKAGSNVDLATDELMARAQKNLPQNAALLSFHLGERQSFLWAISRDRFRMYELPRKADLTAAIAQFSDAVRAGDASAVSRGRALYEALFGNLEAPFRGKREWMLALDEELFRIPFGALVTGWGGDGPIYLAARHAIRVTTGAVMLAGSRPQGWSAALPGKFLGVGDAIYNTADPRWKGPAEQQRGFPPGVAFAASVAQAGGPALARLPGTAREVESCARIWDARSGAAILLEGAEASPDRLREALRGRLSVIHIAAHFLQEPTAQRSSTIALSLADSGSPQMFSPLEITRTKINAGVVVLSGCSSGRADTLPASGLMGLTRAWLAGGARAVVASHWPTPDDSGPLFVDFYRYFCTRPQAGPAVALQQAQLDMLRAGGWRSRPRYWATYFVVGDQ